MLPPQSPSIPTHNNQWKTSPSQHFCRSGSPWSLGNSKNKSHQKYKAGEYWMNLGRMCSAVQLIKIHTLRTGTRQKRITSGQERAMEGTANTYDNFPPPLPRKCTSKDGLKIIIFDFGKWFDKWSINKIKSRQMLNKQTLQYDASLGWGRLQLNNSKMKKPLKHFSLFKVTHTQKILTPHRLDPLSSELGKAIDARC